MVPTESEAQSVGVQEGDYSESRLNSDFNTTGPQNSSHERTTSREEYADSDADSAMYADPSFRPYENAYWVTPSGGVLSNDELDGIQLALDLGGLTPGLGMPADIGNALLSLIRGNISDAGLSAMAIVPVIGQGATGIKIARAAEDGGSAAEKADEILRNALIEEAVVEAVESKALSDALAAEAAKNIGKF